MMVQLCRYPYVCCRDTTGVVIYIHVAVADVARHVYTCGCCVDSDIVNSGSVVGVCIDVDVTGSVSCIM